MSDKPPHPGVSVTKQAADQSDRALNRRNILLGSTTLAAASALCAGAPIKTAQAQQPARAPAPSGGKPNIRLTSQRA